MIRLFKSLEKIFLPYVCILCQLKSDQNKDLCQSCEINLPWLEQSCIQCAEPLTGETFSQKCGLCLKSPPPFERTLALFDYKAPVISLISQLKFHQKLVNARVLGELLSQKIGIYYDGHFPDCIIPVPLHRSRLRERGYNQALELARPISKQWQIQICARSCKRIKKTSAQTALNAIKRRQNLKKAFMISHKFSAEYVAILDDVVTTGSTVLELSASLRQSGIKKIDIWCIARTTRLF